MRQGETAVCMRVRGVGTSPSLTTHASFSLSCFLISSQPYTLRLFASFSRGGMARSPQIHRVDVVHFFSVCAAKSASVPCSPESLQRPELPGFGATRTNSWRVSATLCCATPRCHRETSARPGTDVPVVSESLLLLRIACTWRAGCSPTCRAG